MSNCHSGVSNAAQAAIQSHIVERGSVHAQPAKPLLGAVQGKVIEILVDDDLGQQSGAGQPLVDRLRRLGGHGDLAFATLAGVLDLLVLDDEHLGRLVVVLFGGLDADLAAGVAALGAAAFRLRQFVTPLFATQMCRRLPPAVRLALAASAGRLVRRRRRRGW